MKAITSRDNPLYKELKNLASSSQVRRKTGRTLLDGIHLCQAYLQHLGAPQLCVVSESSRTHHEVELIVAQCLAKATQTICLPDALYQALSQVEHGIGLMFIITTPNPEFPVKLKNSSVVLDNLQDPGNLGSILRSAAAPQRPAQRLAHAHAQDSCARNLAHKTQPCHFNFWQFRHGANIKTLAPAARWWRRQRRGGRHASTSPAWVLRSSRMWRQ